MVLSEVSVHYSCMLRSVKPYPWRQVGLGSTICFSMSRPLFTKPYPKFESRFKIYQVWRLSGRIVTATIKLVGTAILTWEALKAVLLWIAVVSKLNSCCCRSDTCFEFISLYLPISRHLFSYPFAYSFAGKVLECRENSSSIRSDSTHNKMTLSR